jgi:Zn finger protein HypA/HybF involved in hydrogenase expression
VAGTSTASGLRHRTRLPSGPTSDLVRTARALGAVLPASETALGSGEITVQHARTIARTARLVEARTDQAKRSEAVAQVERVMLDVGRAVDAGSLHGFATRVRQVVDPDGALRDANQAHERRWLSASKTIDGMVAIDGLLEADAGALVLTALAAATSPPAADDHRNAGQRRADALVDICGVSLDHGRLRSSGTVRPHLLVTAPLQTLSARPRDPDIRTTEVGEVSWTGPLSDQAVQRLGCDATVTRMLLDAESLPLDVGRSTRTVPAHLRQALVVRDRGCVAEGCDRPVAWTEAHHVVHWAEGGRTALDNLVLLCRSHHRKVHDDGWHFAHISDRWTLVPPPERRLSYGALDAGTDQTSDHIGDTRSRGTEHQLPDTREEPGSNGDP